MNAAQRSWKKRSAAELEETQRSGVIRNISYEPITIRGDTIMLQSSIKDGLQSLQNFSSDDILAALGLQRRRSLIEDALVPSVALFAAGAVVGAAAALLLAPKAGTALRRDLTEQARDLGQRLGASASSVAQDVREALPFGSEDDKTRSGNGPSTSNHTATRRV
jgi:hypothetical protein